MRHEDLVALNAPIVPKLMDKVRPEARASARPAPPRRPRHVHRVGLAGRARRPARRGARHDRRHRHRQRDRRRRVHRQPRRAVLLRRRQGRGDRRSSPAGRASTSSSATRTATPSATCRCSSRSAIPSRSTPTRSSSGIAHRRGWPIVIFSRRTKAVVRRTSQAVGARDRWLVRGSFARRQVRQYAALQRPTSASSRPLRAAAARAGG